MHEGLRIPHLLKSRDVGEERSLRAGNEHILYITSLLPKKACNRLTRGKTVTFQVEIVSILTAMGFD